MVVTAKLARTLFVAALALYLIWLAALVTLGVVSGARPAEGNSRPATTAVASPAVPEQVTE
jgi:hypothetical protein